jgi:hypothetical protein
MEKITVNKTEFMDVLQANAKQHRATFLEAMDAYKAASIKLLEEQLERAKNGAPERVFVSLEMPVDHTEDYERVLAMMKMAIGDTLELSEVEFDMYVLDQWGWRRQFAATNAAYGVSTPDSVGTYSI